MGKENIGEKEKVGGILNSFGSLTSFLNLPGCYTKVQVILLGTSAFHLCNLLSVGVLELMMIGYSSLYLPRRLVQGVK